MKAKWALLDGCTAGRKEDGGDIIDSTSPSWT